MKKPIIWGALALTAGLALLAGRSWFAQEDSGLPASRAASSSAASPAASASGATAQAAEGFPASAARDEEALLTHMQGRYGGRLTHPSFQVKLLEELIRYFRAKYPAGWEEVLLEFLRVAFPEHYEELRRRLQSWLAYERWMQENEAYLQQLGGEERRANIWEARNRLFGEEIAEKLWASELKHEAVRNALRAIDARTDASLSDKLAQYRHSLQETYGEQAESYLERHRQEAMNRFLDLGSVQRELSAMTPGQRQRSLRELRVGMGLDEEALKRWDVLDRERDQRWDLGARYMAEREALAKKYSGAELEERLRSVRERYFGEEAETVAREEQSGFFRFERPRVWGRN